MGKGSTSRLAKFRVAGLGAIQGSVEVSGEIHLDGTLHEFPDKIDLYGSEPEYMAMLMFVGDLVELEELSRAPSEHRTYICRVHKASDPRFQGDDHVGRVAELSVKKAVSEIERGPSDEHYCSYTYSTDVIGWPSTGGFELSYEGTIGLSKLKEGLHVLLKKRGLEMVAAPHYYFHDDGTNLVRKRLSSIQVKWKKTGLDAKRLIECARLVLSFTHTVKLRPLAKAHSSENNFRWISWSPESIETAERDRFSGPVSISQRRGFHSKAIESLAKSPHSIDFIDGIIDRYVEARTDVTLERSFAHGCEAIEGLYALLKAQVTSKGGHSTYAGVRRKLKAIIREEVEHEEDKTVAISRVDQLFSRPAWHRIAVLLTVLAKDKDDLIHEVVDRANFFRYRNLSSHGQVVRLDNGAYIRM